VLCPFGKAWTIDGISYLNGGSSRDWECQLEQAMTLVIVTPVRHAFWPSIIPSFYTTAKVSINTRDRCSNSAISATKSQAGLFLPPTRRREGVLTAVTFLSLGGSS
jgi:hypothetical protein